MHAQTPAEDAVLDCLAHTGQCGHREMTSRHASGADRQQGAGPGGSSTAHPEPRGEAAAWQVRVCCCVRLAPCPAAPTSSRGCGWGRGQCDTWPAAVSQRELAEWKCRRPCSPPGNDFLPPPHSFFASSRANGVRSISQVRKQAQRGTHLSKVTQLPRRQG